MEKKKTKQKLLLLWERKLNVLLLFHYSTFFCMRCFLYKLTFNITGKTIIMKKS